MSTIMLKVGFRGDTLDACGTTPEDAEVSIRRVCENLGVSMQGQIKKLQGKAWATVNFKLMVAEDNKPREVAMLALKSLPMWLATIDPRKVKEQFREKLARYQQECHDVLAAHFLTKRPGAVSVDADQLVKLVGRVEHLQQQIDRMAEMRATLSTHIPMNATPRTTVQERLRYKGWVEALATTKAAAKIRSLIRRQANVWLMLRHNETPDVSGGPGAALCYYGHQIAVLDEAIDYVRDAVRRREEARERVTGPTLFSPPSAA